VGPAGETPAPAADRSRATIAAVSSTLGVRRSLAIVAAAAAVAVVAGGCGGVVRVGAGRTLRIALSEYRLRPDRVTATSGRLTVVARNVGVVTHSLTILRGARTVASTRAIAPGHVRMLTVQLAPGRYSIASTVLSDADLGAYGTLTVTR
jgi:hypothetical protein